jgi:hypothetical protein
VCPNFQLRAIPFSLQHFSSSSSREASENYQFYHRMIHRGEDCKDFLKKKHGNQFCMHVEEHLDGSCMLQILCLCLWQICSMFWPKELGPISKDRYTVLSVLFFLMDLLLKKICLGVLVAASFLDLTPLLIGMVR